MRQHVDLTVDVTREIPEPSGRLLQFVTRIDPDAAPLQAILVGGPDADRLLVYFPGFNTPLGPWEAAKCRMLAGAFGQRVLLIEIRTPEFPSGRGIRVGTPLDNLKTMYGDALKSTAMTDGGAQIKQWALTSNTQFVAYVVDAGGAVSRIVIGYRGSGGSITLPPPC